MKRRNRYPKPGVHNSHAVHIRSITTKQSISLGEGIVMNSGCPNHVVVNVPDKADRPAP